MSYDEEIERTIFVNGLSYESQEDDIRYFFEECGDIERINLPKYQNSVRNIGYCHVRFTKRRYAKRALKLNGKYLDKRYLRIEMAQDMRHRRRDKHRGRDRSRDRGRDRDRDRSRDRDRGEKHRPKRSIDLFFLLVFTFLTFFINFLFFLIFHFFFGNKFLKIFQKEVIMKMRRYSLRQFL